MTAAGVGTETQHARHVRKELPALGEFTVSKLIEQFGIKVETARGYVRTWEAEGHIVELRRERKVRIFMEAKLAAKAGFTANDDKPTAEGNMWRAMRLMNSFTPLELALHATAAEVKVDEKLATAYSRGLMLAGYLQVVEKAIHGRRPIRYRLIHNSGPKAPQFKRVRSVFDPNENVHNLLDGATR